MSRDAPITSAESAGGTSRRFLLWWILTFLGFPPGGLLAIIVVGSIGGVSTGALAGILAGASIGTAQWLALRRRLGISPLWIAATAIGLSLGDAVGAALTGAGTQIGDLLVTGLASGLAVGILQWPLLRGRVRRSGLWPIVVTLAWPIAWTVTWAFGVDVERGYAVFGATGALTFVTFTALTLWVLLRNTGRRTHGRVT